MATGASDGWFARSDAGAVRQRIARYIKYTPSGDTLSADRWRSRHRNVLILLAAHLPFLFLLGTFDGNLVGATFESEPLLHVAAEVGILGAFVLLAMVPRFSRRTRAAIASAGLMTTGAILAHFSGGFIEAHFHFFVMVGVIATYEDWLPFGISILYVALEHGLFSIIDPSGVYNHPAAIANPWAWALIHAVFVLGLAGAIMSNWFSIERAREETRQQLANVKKSEEAQAEAEEAKAEAQRQQEEVEQLNDDLLDSADDLAGAMHRVAQGDLTATPPKHTDIEAVDEISSAFEEMTGELSDTIVDIRAFAATVERTTASAHDDVEQLEATQRELVADIREFANELRAQAQELEATTGELSTLSATIEEIAANADEVSREAGLAAESAESGTERAADAIEAVEQIETTVATLADIVDSLAGRMDTVSESTDLIEEIAEETNMLALNANIEAARTGSDGDGFAVVADEVKTLAEDTREHSASIETAIEQTIADVDRVQQEMEQTKADIRTGEETMTAASDAFDELAGTVEDVDVSINEVANATDDGARTTEEVVDAIQRVADRSRTVADHSESLADRTEEGAETVSTIREQLGELTEQTATLQRQLESFECDSSTEQTAD
ncbi:methyl-accepting chemotaxis protein [Halobaculum limi]|uniref:methyl-accepting chemotaxis protein n=1 Tax=Halobaculum limi TaxID=3031916 RepID=UPI002405028C|nr:methyl-accepting chemotaxis protein [Halobaculum sp. YSMS11]